MFADEYLMASFADVCSIFDAAVERVVGPAGTTGLRAVSPLRQVSAGVASLHLDWRDEASPTGWAPGEVRVLQVQSGLTPRTELMIAAPPVVAAGAARDFLEALAKAVQKALMLALPA